MSALCQVLCFCLVAMLGLQNTAAAAQISFKVCISAETDFSDADMGDKLLSDTDDPEQFSCDVGFDADPESIPEFDVLGWYCLDSGDSENRATEYDVLRAFWDLVTYYDQSPETIFDIWAAADTDTWIAAGTGTGGNYPSQRMSEAAYDVGGSGLKVDYDENADYNGILR